jgi:hypothetical protein
VTGEQRDRGGSATEVAPADVPIPSADRASQAPPRPGLREWAVEGEIRTLASRQGSSGIFTGSLSGQYEGYRFASTDPDERSTMLDLPNGTLALTVRQEIVTPLEDRPARHPFEGGRDPFASQPRYGRLRALGRILRHAWISRTPQFNPFKRVHYVRVTLAADPARSTGIFAGASGAVELETPNYRMAGYIVLTTKEGILRLNFLERGSRRLLSADMTVDGAQSTGIFRNAAGSLSMDLNVSPPNFGRGPYRGTIWLDPGAVRG